MTAIKVCGLATEASCDAVVDAIGVAYVGFNLWPGSRRCVSASRADELVSRLPARIKTVALFVDPDADTVRRAVETCDFDLLQFHGDESPAFCRSFGRPFMKAFRLRDASILDRIDDYLDSEDHPYLVDAYVAGQVGGTGQTAPWDLAARARERGAKMVLAGGLNAANVAQAIDAVRPWAVDVASGVESAPGQKDPAMVAAFVAAVEGSP